MKFIAITALFVLSACLQAGPITPVANPGLPTLNCTVASFTSDTGEADFIRNNRRKLFELVSTSDGITSNVTSAVFSNSTVDFAITQVTDSQIDAVRRGTSSDATLIHSMTVDRTPANGTYRAVQTVTNTFPEAMGIPTSRNIWTLACREAA